MQKTFNFTKGNIELVRNGEDYQILTNEFNCINHKQENESIKWDIFYNIFSIFFLIPPITILFFSFCPVLCTYFWCYYSNVCTLYKGCRNCWQASFFHAILIRRKPTTPHKGHVNIRPKYWPTLWHQATCFPQIYHVTNTCKVTELLHHFWGRHFFSVSSVWMK